MSWYDPDKEDTTIYKVVVNHEEQYSIWPEYKTHGNDSYGNGPFRFIACEKL